MALTGIQMARLITQLDDEAARQEASAQPCPNVVFVDGCLSSEERDFIVARWKAYFPEAPNG